MVMNNMISYKLILVITTFVVVATSDLAQDKQKCENQLIGVATCLPYVSGQSNFPPMDCCKGFNQVLANSPACICLLIKDRNDPSLGLTINATRAIGMPTRCKSHNNLTVQDCPAILHLAPHSPDAKVFEDFANNGNASSATAPSSAKNSPPSSSLSATPAEDHHQNSDGGKSRKIKASGIVFWFAMVALIIIIN